MCQRTTQQGHGKEGTAITPSRHCQRARSSVTLTVLCLLPDDALQVHAGPRLAGAQALGLGGQRHIAGVHPHRAGAYHDLLARRRDVVVDDRDKEVQGQHCRRRDWRFHLWGKRDMVTVRNTVRNTEGRTSTNRPLRSWRTSSSGLPPLVHVPHLIRGQRSCRALPPWHAPTHVTPGSSAVKRSHPEVLMQEISVLLLERACAKLLL